MDTELEQIAEMGISYGRPKYSVQDINTYDKERHASVDYVFDLLKETDLNSLKLVDAMHKGLIKEYEFKKEKIAKYFRYN